MANPARPLVPVRVNVPGNKGWTIESFETDYADLNGDGSIITLRGARHLPVEPVGEDVAQWYPKVIINLTTGLTVFLGSPEYSASNAHAQRHHNQGGF
jgi:hypothetical protein